MSGTWGKNFKITIFGESHSAGIGIILDGLPSGIKLNMDYISSQMQRRRGGDAFSTPRAEADKVEILSGFFNGKTTGTPLAAVIYNNDTHSKDYDSDILRPSHGDFTGKVKYNECNDYRGGGHFSGRLTAPLTFAGSVAKYILEEQNIGIAGRIKSIKNVEDVDISGIDDIFNIADKNFPTISLKQKELMQQEILNAKNSKDSVGGIVEVVAKNLPIGLGDPFFNSLESSISSLLFSVPAVKAVEFGDGFEITKLLGSQGNDSFYFDKINNVIKTKTNHNGGILGGISNGMPIILRCGIKPTPSIGQPQNTVNFATNEDVVYTIRGRHDPCIVKRAVVVIESVVAIALLDFLI